MLLNNWQENYYTSYKGVDLYVDYTNERLKISNVLSLSENKVQEIIGFAKQQGLGKIITNCQEQYVEFFLKCGFVAEGTINGYFKGKDAVCLSLFTDEKRKKSIKEEEENKIIDFCLSDVKTFTPREERNYTLRRAVKEDIPQMINLFSNVFESYPSPVNNINYLQNVMREQVLFKVAEEEGNIISIASADMNRIYLNAEITDCATYPAYRGKNIMSEIIYSLEADLKSEGFITAYSLSRAKNIGINKSLSKLGYRYGGRMLNNCHICGGYENMNVWVKIIKK